MFLVEIDDDQRVLKLKNAIKTQKSDTITAEADQLQLFLAKGEDRNWLGDESELARQLIKGQIPQDIQALIDGGENILPSKAINRWLEKNGLPLPSSDQIHVLVYVPPKRRRLENANPLADIPQIDIQGAKYVTLPGELVAKCGLTPRGDLMLYCRPQVHKLWGVLRDDVIAKGVRGWILGPPGTGKSACLLSFAASLDPQEWNVVWIHLDEKGDFCVSMGSKQHWIVDDRSTFELPRVSSEKLFVCLDGYRKCDAHTALLRRVLVRFIKEHDRLVVCSSMAARGKRDVESDTIAGIEPFFMYSWTLDEYIEAVSDQTFYDKVAAVFDATNDWDVNGDDDDDDDGNDDDDENTKTSRKEEQKLRLLRLKFYYAGGSCRFMFQYSTDRVKEVVEEGVESVENKADLVRYCSGILHKDTLNRLYGMQSGSRLHGGRFPVSSFVSSTFAKVCDEIVIHDLAAHLNVSNNPSVDGHLFEWLFLVAVPQRKVELLGDNNIVDVLPRASVLQFNPKKKFKTLRGEEKQGEISGKHQRNKYDIGYEDGGKDASVDGEFIWLSDGSIKEEFEVGDKVVVEMPNILGNRSWLQPVDWNQGGYDAVYFDTKVNKVIFIQVTRSEKHTFKMRFFKEVLIKLRSAGMRRPSVEVFFVVKLNQLMNFSISSIDDRGAIEEFDKQWIGLDEDHVKVRAFKATPAQ